MAYNCPNNTYGANAKSYGLKSQPCKPCPRGLYSPPASNDLSSCVNFAGFGFNGLTAEPCQPGYYKSANELGNCSWCGYGRNTTARTSPPFFTDTTLPATIITLGDAQDGVEDCKVAPGYGMDPFDISGDPAADVAKGVQPCIQGFFSLGGEFTTVCSPCPPPTTNAADPADGAPAQPRTTCDSKYRADWDT